MWRCSACRRQFTVLTATILQGTRTDLRTWIGALARCADTPVVTPAQVAVEFGVTAEAARVVVGRVTVARTRAAHASPVEASPVEASPVEARPVGASLVEASPVQARAAAESGHLSDAAQRLIRAVLALPASVAAEVRAQAPARRRPLRQQGPTAEFGADRPV